MQNILSFDSYNEKKRTKNPCWKGYKQYGTKKKNGKIVPNCVPTEDTVTKTNSNKSNNEKFVVSFDEFELLDEKKTKDPRIIKAGVEGYNKPKRTPNHPTKSHIVVAKEGDKIKTLRFGEQGAETAGKPKEGESKRMKSKRKRFKSRHGRNIKKGKMSAAYWSWVTKW